MNITKTTTPMPEAVLVQMCELDERSNDYAPFSRERQIVNDLIEQVGAGYDCETVVSDPSMDADMVRAECHKMVNEAIQAA